MVSDALKLMAAVAAVVVLAAVVAYCIMPPKENQQIIDYGNGVLYFCSTGDNFGNELSSFIESHPNLEMIGISRGSKGFDNGYFVIFQEKQN